MDTQSGFIRAQEEVTTDSPVDWIDKRGGKSGRGSIK